MHFFDKSRATTILMCVFCALNSEAQVTQPVEKPLDVDAGLGVEIRYDDNIFSSATGVTSSWIPMLSPSLAIKAKPSKHSYELLYDGEIAWYTDSSPDDYDDHFLRGGAYFELGEKSKLDIVGSFDAAHQNRGTGITEGFIPATNEPPSPDEYNLANVSGKYGFGGNASNTRVVFEARYRDLDFTTNRDRTRFFDRSDAYGDLSFYYRVLPKTVLLLGARLTKIEYDNVRPLQASLDSTEQRYFVGATWDATAKTKGTVKLGDVRKDFTERESGDFSESSWDVDIRWSPKTYSHFDFGTARYPSETTGGGNFIDNTVFSVAWMH